MHHMCLAAQMQGHTLLGVAPALYSNSALANLADSRACRPACIGASQTGRAGSQARQGLWRCRWSVRAILARGL